MRSELVSKMLALVLAAGTACAATAGDGPTGAPCSLRISEVHHNPKTSGDDAEWEFIEIVGQPNTSLSGLAIVVVSDNGGAEVDESFIFPAGDKYRTNGSGFFVLWNGDSDEISPDEGARESGIWGWLEANTGITRGLDPLSEELSGASLRFEAYFKEVGTLSVEDGEPAGKLENDGSLSFLLLSGWSTDAAISKDAVVTDSTTAGTPDFTTASGILDAVAYSDNGGEYAGLEGREIDDTPGFKPDALTRVDDVEPEQVYAGRFIAGAEAFRDAYTNWVYGDMASNAPAFGYDGSKALGGVNLPAASGTATQPAVNIALTPGTQNASFNGRGGGSIGVSCPVALAAPDFDGNGVVDFQDLMRASREGDAETIREIVEALAR